MRIVLVGYGKMGRLVGALAPEAGCDVAAVVDPTASTAGSATEAAASVGEIDWSGVDVAIDFTTPDAVMANVPAVIGRGVNVVLGTTGWRRHEPELRRLVNEAGVGLVAAPNFSTGVVLFEVLIARAARLFAEQPAFGAYLHEAHHAAKKDAPSGTALLLRQAMERSGFPRPVDVSSTRAGHIPGIHTVGFDGPSETITLTHAARDRSAFARGALQAARWVRGRRGWFTMHDVLAVGDV